MNQENRLLQQEHIRSACTRALEDADQLQEALEILYCEGMRDTAPTPDVQRSFARRAIEMYDELKYQLLSCRCAPEDWLQAQIEDVGENGPQAVAMVNGACAMAAELHKGNDVQYMEMLSERLDVICPKERLVQLLSQYINTPLQELFFTWQSYPLLNAVQQKSAACLLAMLSYIEIKTNPEVDMAPDVSFDSVCILAGTVTEIMCRPQEDVRQERAEERACMGYAQVVAVACGVMCSQYMWISSVQVCIGCVRSLVRGIRLFFRYLGELLGEDEFVEEGHIVLEDTSRSYDFEKNWELLLAPTQKNQAAREFHRETRGRKNVMYIREKAPE